MLFHCLTFVCIMKLAGELYDEWIQYLEFVIASFIASVYLKIACVYLKSQVFLHGKESPYHSHRCP